MASYLSKKWFVIFIFVSLLSFQLIYGFVFPSSGSSDNWLPPTAYVPKFTPESSDNLFLEKIYPLISTEYRLNSDVGGYLELGRHFNSQYFEEHTYLSRPLYPFLIYLFSLPLGLFIAPSYGIIFALAILINFILINLTVLLFFSLLKRFFSFKVAFLSSILLIFSPFVRSFLVQPLPHILTIFTVMLSFYLLARYVNSPRPTKLIIFSSILGLLMLGMMIIAIPIFILLLAFYFRRFREGIIFAIFLLIPLALWYLWTTQIWQISYYFHEVEHHQMGAWLFNIFHWPWYQTAQTLISAVPSFITNLIYAFILLPVVLSVIGFQKLVFKRKNVFYFGFLFSVFLLCFGMNLYPPRIIFLLFPVIYPTAILGIESIANLSKKYCSLFAPVFWALSIGLMIFISNINIYKIFDYLKSL